VTAWLAASGPPDLIPRDDPSTLFTKTLLEGLGRESRPRNLAAALAALQHEPTLKLRGFRSAGVVPPGLTVWASLYGRPPAEQRPEMVLQLGHADKITAIVGTPDGQRLFSSSLDSTVRAWSVKSGVLERVLAGHEVGATALALSADGRWLVSGGGRPANAILLHDLANDFRLSAPGPKHMKRVDQVVMLPDGDHFVSLDDGARAFLWDLTQSPPSAQEWLPGAACRAVAAGGAKGQGHSAVLCGDRSVRVFDASGAGKEVRLEWPEQPLTIALDPTGHWLAVGFADGKVLVRDLESNAERSINASAGPLQLSVSRLGALAVGHVAGLTYVPPPSQPAAAVPVEHILTPQPNACPIFAPDGLSLAASFKNSPGLIVWRVSDAAGPRSILEETRADVAALAFTSDGRSVVTGGFKGAVKIWPLEEGAKGVAWSVEPNRAKVRRVEMSPSRRLLVMLNDLGWVQVWDIKERTCRRLPGRWTSAAFLGSDDVLAMTEEPEKDRPGRAVIVRLGEARISIDSAFFQRTAEGFDLAEKDSFTGLTVSPDGKFVAAAALASQVPLVCVWDAKTGQLSRWLTSERLDDPARSLSFSSDGRFLVTSGDSSEARLWDLSAPEREPKAPAVVLRSRKKKLGTITASAIRPGATNQVVTGHRDGSLFLWTWKDGVSEPAEPRDIAEGAISEGAVKAISFVDAGTDSYIAAAGDATSLWVARLGAGRPEPLDLGLPPHLHHAEQINTLASWATAAAGKAPATTTLVSGSDDATVKLWDLSKKAFTLRGTFAVESGAAAPPAEGTANLDWVVFVPDGRFDASPGGRKLVRFSQAGGSHALEQFDDTALWTVDLASQILAASSTRRPLARWNEAPPILVEPILPSDATQPVAAVDILLGSDGLTDVRLYHNDRPVATGLEKEARPVRGAEGGPLRTTVPVALLKGANRFHAKASYQGRKGVFDSLSPDVEIAYEGPANNGRLHVLALGVGDYRRNRLKFAARDADQLSKVLHDRGLEVAGKKGLRRVRTGQDVTAEGVKEDFSQLRREAKPEDTVVVFLAGHTGVFSADQFCLLLPAFPFAEKTPIVVASRSGVVARDSVGADTNASVDPAYILPYSVIEQNLMELKALQRLVILDACQAEAITDDPEVQNIRRWMEIRSRRARTSYLLAARRGEPALEAEGLRHGLFTYALLRGMGPGALDRTTEPREVSQLTLPADADFNHDGVISTRELDDYTRQTLPSLARIFPAVVTRARAEQSGVSASNPRPDIGPLDQDLRVQSANQDFELFRVPGS
jgi:WD40 repeat protein